MSPRRPRCSTSSSACASGGLGVLLISHNLADVQAVADRAVVLRLGRNNGEFRIADVSYEDIIAAITGATDNVVTRREAAVRAHNEEKKK